MEPNMEGQAQTSSSKLILCIIGILVVAAVAFALVRSQKGPEDMATTTPDVAADGSYSGNIFDLAARGGDWKCTWASTENGISMTGTTYVGRGKFKSDFEMTGSGMNVVAHAVSDGEFVYSWTSLSSQGIKFPVSAEAEGVAVSGTNAQTAQFAKDYSYTCESWAAGSGEFALPDGITFTEAVTQ